MTRAVITTNNPCYGDLLLGGTSLYNGYAWTIYDETGFFETTDLRGADIVVPGDEGVLAEARRKTVTVRTWGLLIVGDRDRLGNVNADQYEGLVANWQYLNDNLFTPGAHPSTVAATWDRPTIGDKTADVHVLPFKPKLVVGGGLVGALQLSFPNGDWT